MIGCGGRVSSAVLFWALLLCLLGCLMVIREVKGYIA